jgi:hypothetical protein
VPEAGAVSGETDLGRLLAGLEPAVDPRPYLYVAVPAGREAGLTAGAFAAIREQEGLCVVIDAEAAERAGVAGDGPRLARLTLRVQSSLLAVGLTAAVASRLAAAGIAANPIAGRLHDHLLVPWEARERALAELRSLSRESAGGAPAPG